MFSAHEDSSHYTPLLEHSRLDDRDCDSANNLTRSNPSLDEKQSKSRKTSWVLIIVIMCTLLNIMLSIPFTTFASNEASDNIITRQNIHLLRRPNQYIGLDEIPRPHPPVARQLTTYPILLSLVDAESPDTVFDDDFAMKMVRGGTITPDDRRVRVTPTMSTIVQFRAIDWGMEICELHLDLPEQFGHQGHSGALALYRLNSTIPLDTSSLAFNNRPPRIANVGNIQLGNGIVEWHRKFNCEMDEVLSFELSCIPSESSIPGGNSDCDVKWVQIKDTTPAVYMVQHSTI